MRGLVQLRGTFCVEVVWISVAVVVLALGIFRWPEGCEPISSDVSLANFMERLRFHGGMHPC